MTRVVLSVGSNLGDRLARLQAAVDAVGPAVLAVSPVYETDAWGGVDQGPFLNAVLVADDPALDAHGWLRKAQAIESANQRVREQKWGPRTLDVDLVCVTEDGAEVVCNDSDLTLPHPFAHQRAFVLAPWLDVEPAAELLVEGCRRPVRDVIAELDPVERSGVRLTGYTLNVGPS
jgi:2-amino-4-hydroxy-6-hydroxymethyldihydropteridine diphosphokinase